MVKNKKNLYIAIFALVLVVAIGAFMIFSKKSSQNPNDLGVSSQNLSELLNDEEYESVQEIADKRLYDQELSSQERSDAFYMGLNSRIAFDNPEFAYRYIKDNASLINELELPFDFYVIAGDLSVENQDPELAVMVYEKALEFEFEDGLSEELSIQAEIREKLNEIR